MSSSNDGIEILGTTYSSTPRGLFDEMQRSTGGKPVEFTEITGHEDGKITVRPDKIIVGVHRGSSEDNVAHEFMHVILSAEGFPETFSLATSELSEQLNGLITSDFDHLIINDRLVRVGYDARRGFLAKADSHQPLLTYLVVQSSWITRGADTTLLALSLLLRPRATGRESPRPLSQA